MDKTCYSASIGVLSVTLPFLLQQKWNHSKSLLAYVVYFSGVQLSLDQQFSTNQPPISAQKNTSAAAKGVFL